MALLVGLLENYALSTFLGQWGPARLRGRSRPTYEELVETEGRPWQRYRLGRPSTEGVLAHAALVCGYFPVVSE